MYGYSETILKYAIDDSHTGVLEQPDGIGEVGLGAEEAGRKLAVRFMLKCAGERVDTIRYQVFGCGYTMAACAAAAELGEGQSLAELESWTARVIDQQLGGMPRERDYCADLAVKALRAAASSVHARRRVATVHDPTEEHGPKINVNNPTYRTLMASANPNGCAVEDRHLFACLLAVADSEAAATHAALGLPAQELDFLVRRFFPACGWQAKSWSAGDPRLPEINPEIRELLQEHVTMSPDPEIAAWLADILVARAAHPGHLWIAMGLFERPQLSAAIGRHLPSLLAANDKGMRWKRFLFKQVCDLNGGVMCKSPVCGDCSDYSLCFAE
ncbi:hydrogenase [Geothermobacter hydrogeniphilus]|uniref:Hydrogenase n=1 Tax=Geothermobacter hydrogeniphilus TaxID=1969733 RepID=A0A2K2H6R7_9BACT|nr:nitrogen fixation protein NifQ [Geothermobacter hydrogeniphilus]PNU18940.1 hydrogenase [Geothermobacter hydrogeniphilus]